MPSSPKLLPGLDLIRVALLLFGPIMHGGYMVSAANHRVEWIDTIIEASHSFRMAAFFAISGFLISHRDCFDRPQWLSKRVRELMLPVVTVWILFLIPMTLWLNQRNEGGSDYFAPHHLWFLIDLTLLTIIQHSLVVRGLINPLVANLKRAVLFMSACSVPLYLFGIKLATLCSWGLWSEGLAFLPFYQLFFTAGYIVARDPSACNFLRTSRTLVPVGLLSLTASLAWYNIGYEQWLPPLHASALYRGIYYVFKSISSVTMTAALLGVSLRLAFTHPIATHLRAAAFTVYLVHYPITVVLGRYVSAEEFGNFVAFAMISGVSFGASLIFHELVVRRHATAALLFNGNTRYAN